MNESFICLNNLLIRPNEFFICLNESFICSNETFFLFERFTYSSERILFVLTINWFVRTKNSFFFGLSTPPYVNPFYFTTIIYHGCIYICPSKNFRFIALKHHGKLCRNINKFPNKQTNIFIFIISKNEIIRFKWIIRRGAFFLREKCSIFTLQKHA